MDKHRVTLKSALHIVNRILTSSRVGVLGQVHALGSLVVAEYSCEGVQVTIQVSFQPMLTIDISGSATPTRNKTDILESMLGYAETTADTLRATFELLQVSPMKKVA